MRIDGRQIGYTIDGEEAGGRQPERHVHHGDAAPPGAKRSMPSEAMVPPSSGSAGMRLTSPITGPAHQMA